MAHEHHLDGEDKTPVYVGYFGTSRPSHYHIRANDLLRCPAWTEGIYCISGTYLQQVYADCPGPWTSDYERDYQAALEPIHALEIADPATRDRMLRSRGEAYWNRTRLSFQHLRVGRLALTSDSKSRWRTSGIPS